MAYFKINFGCGCGDNEEYLEFNSQEEADRYAYEKAVEDYESFAGLHGIRDYSDIAEEDFGVDWYEINDGGDDFLVAQIQCAYQEEVENQISYGAEEISEEEYLEYLEEEW